MKTTITTIALLSVSAGAASASFTDFVIRHGTSAPIIQTNNTYVPGATEFIISEGGQKAALGSNGINGATISSINGLKITRHDDSTRFTAGSGPAVAPYFNLWVTDGLGNYAVIANEPSNGAFQALQIDNGNGSFSYDLDFADLSNKAAKVYETPGWNTGTSWVHAMFGAGPLTFANLATLEIAPPPPSYITNAANEVGSGAPDVLGTNVAYGFNWVFGDTLSNYVSGPTAEGYVVSGFEVPAPGSAALLGLGGLVATRRRRA
jgi:MYXO-CTERM domain-containing protein